MGVVRTRSGHVGGRVTRVVIVQFVEDGEFLCCSRL